MNESSPILVIDKPKCILCGLQGQMLYEGVHDRLYGVQGEWSIYTCTNCNLTWLNPMPVVDEIPRLYVQYYTHTTNHKPVNKESLFGYIRSSVDHRLIKFLTQTKLLDPLQLPYYWSKLWFNDHTGKILDYGCGNGDFLAIMNRFGWQTFGIEPDLHAAQIAQSQKGIINISSDFEQAGYPENYFDLVRMNHVIEHLPDSKHALNECYRILKPGCRLLIYTPNLNSFGHKLFKQHWLHLDPPRHLIMYSTKSLRKLLEEVGFEIISIRTTTRGASSTYLTSLMIKRCGRLPQDWRKSLKEFDKLQAYSFQVREILDFSRAIGEDLEVMAIK